MSIVYQLLGALGLVSGLLWALYRLLKDNAELKANNRILEETGKYNDEVIKELSKPVPTTDDVADSLHKGTF